MPIKDEVTKSGWLVELLKKGLIAQILINFSG